LSSVWPGVSVEEATLRQNIFTLRRILGEKPRDRRFIVTIPGSGYRFVANVEIRAPCSSVNKPAVSNTSKAVKPSQSLERRAPLVAFAFTLGLIVVFSFGFRQDRAPEYSAVPLTSDQGSAQSPSFSPEGELVAFS
jgi:hypothetical protein